MDWTTITDALITGLLQGSLYALMAAGLTIVFGVLHMLNLTHGDLMIVGSFTSYYLLTLVGVDPILSIPISFLVAALVGLIMFELTLRKALEAPLLNQIVLTFGLVMVLEGVMAALFTPEWKIILTPYSTMGIDIGITRVSAVRAIAAIISLLSFVLLYILLLKTDIGRSMRAVAQNRVAAALLGINVDKVFRISFCIGTGLAGVAGVLLGMLFPFTPYSGLEYVLLAFLIVVLGGMGSIPGAIVGGLIAGIIEAIVSVFISQQFGLVALYIAFLVILSFRPSGIMGVEVERG